MSTRSTGAFCAMFLATTLVSSCQFGLDYSGDESGLARESLPVSNLPGRELSYLKAGAPQSPRVLFIHGSPGEAAMYSSYLRELEDVSECIAVDRLGYGQSAGSGVVVSFEEQAAAIAPLLEKRNGLWPIVVGHSLGGPIAARLAADNPDRVGALIIIAGGLNPEFEELRWYNKIARWRLLQPFMAEFVRTSNREMWGAYEQVTALDEVLGEITCPVVFIHGTEDSLVPFETLEHSIDRFRGHPEAYVLVMIGEGHSITKLRKEEVLETVRDLLNGLTEFVEPDDEAE